MEKPHSYKYFLVDNGSLRPESIISLREVANKLTEKCGENVEPAGIMHSHKINSIHLNSKKALTMEKFFDSKEAENVSRLLIIPMFLGPSLAITDWLKRKLTVWKESNPDRFYSVAHCLHKDGDNRISRALYTNVIDEIRLFSGRQPFVILVDHGTPLKKVNSVRETVGNELKRLLTNKICGFSTACMERRSGTQYDYNDPLLEVLLHQIYRKGVREVVLAQLFLLPGRHAGPDGDLAMICNPYEKKGMKIYRTQTLACHPLILEILIERIKETKFC